MYAREKDESRERNGEMERNTNQKKKRPRMENCLASWLLFQSSHNFMECFI